MQIHSPVQFQLEADESGSPDDDFGHVVAAIDMKEHGTVGCAYYSAEEEKLYLLGDSQSSGAETIDTCTSVFQDLLIIFQRIPIQLTLPLVLLQIKPTVILTPSRTDLLGPENQNQNLAQDNGILHEDRNWMRKPEH